MESTSWFYQRIRTWNLFAIVLNLGLKRDIMSQVGYKFYKQFNSNGFKFYYYFVIDIPDQWRNLWSQCNSDQSHFAKPDANPYLTTDFTLIELPVGGPTTNFPISISTPEDNFSLWYRQDSKFRIPKAVLNFYLISPMASDCARRLVNTFFLR